MRCVVREPGGMTGQRRSAVHGAGAGGPDPAASDLILGTPGERLPVHTQAYADEILSGAVRVYGRTEAQLGGLTATLDLFSLAAASDEAIERRRPDGQRQRQRTARGRAGCPAGRLVQRAA